MKGDYHRYLAEFKTGVERKEAAESTLSAYKAAQESPNEDGQQGSEENETLEAGPSGEATELLCSNHGTVIATPIADITLASHDPVVGFVHDMGAHRFANGAVRRLPDAATAARRLPAAAAAARRLPADASQLRCFHLLPVQQGRCRSAAVAG